MPNYSASNVPLRKDAQGNLLFPISWWGSVSAHTFYYVWIGSASTPAFDAEGAIAGVAPSLVGRLPCLMVNVMIVDCGINVRIVSDRMPDEGEDMDILNASIDTALRAALTWWPDDAAKTLAADQSQRQAWGMVNPPTIYRIVDEFDTEIYKEDYTDPRQAVVQAEALADRYPRMIFYVEQSDPDGHFYPYWNSKDGLS